MVAQLALRRSDGGNGVDALRFFDGDAGDALHRLAGGGDGAQQDVVGVMPAQHRGDGGKQGFGELTVADAGIRRCRAGRAGVRIKGAGSVLLADDAHPDVGRFAGQDAGKQVFAGAGGADEDGAGVIGAVAGPDLDDIVGGEVRHGEIEPHAAGDGCRRDRLGRGRRHGQAHDPGVGGVGDRQAHRAAPAAHIEVDGVAGAAGDDAGRSLPGVGGRAAGGGVGVGGAVGRGRAGNDDGVDPGAGALGAAGLQIEEIEGDFAGENIDPLAGHQEFLPARIPRPIGPGRRQAQIVHGHHLPREQFRIARRTDDAHGGVRGGEPAEHAGGKGLDGDIGGVPVVLPCLCRRRLPVVAGLSPGDLRVAVGIQQGLAVILGAGGVVGERRMVDQLAQEQLFLPAGDTVEIAPGGIESLGRGAGGIVEHRRQLAVRHGDQMHAGNHLQFVQDLHGGDRLAIVRRAVVGKGPVRAADFARHVPVRPQAVVVADGEESRTIQQPVGNAELIHDLKHLVHDVAGQINLFGNLLAG